MKKHFSFIFAVAAALAFTACEDVPAPYEINNNGSGTETDVLLSETFSTSMGGFQNVSTVADYSWAVSYSSVQISGYDSSTSQNNDAESWLVSPTMDFSEVTAAHVSFDYILRYALASTVAENHQLLVSADYQGKGKVEEATWEALSFNLVQGSDWNTWYSSGNVNIPQKYMGGNVTVALRYKSTATKASTWEVKNFLVVKGEGGDEPGKGDEETGVKTLPYSEAFETTLGGFKNETTSGSGEWVIDFKTAKATGYNNTTTETVAGSYYLVSPEISLSGVTEAYVSYEYILRYNKADGNQQLFISADYTDGAATATWTPLCQKHTEGRDWVTFENAQIDIPAEYMGKTIRLAFYYNTNNVSGSTWEVKNFSVQQGKAGEGSGDDPIVPVDPNNLLSNGGFEVWSGSTPVNWKSESTASSATLKQSADAHSGSYSVVVEGSASANKRLASKEITLKKGSYSYTVYLKAETSSNASAAIGYAAIGSSVVYNYKKKEGSSAVDYYDGITNSDWIEATMSFTLDAETKVCLLVMNSKSGGGAGLLVDDAVLTTADGGIVGGDTPSTGDDDTALYSIDFTGSQGGWTIENKQKPDELNYVWAQNSSYGMKASAFYNNTAYDVESWVISPEIDLTNASSSITLSINHAANFFADEATMKAQIAVKASVDGTNWTDLALSAYPNNTSWTPVDATADMSAYAGKKVQLAFVYKATSAKAGTWEVMSLNIR
ncbi:MAG: immune inhibitor A [Bacteroides sp.]|nr:immune inhibitor A [Roseburia sp.]MCM1346998.1 immune inhibitor A [Bacteroides sp.]MCM1421550.1 immune inhibitor A [Bacteroides sp.]